MWTIVLYGIPLILGWLAGVLVNYLSEVLPWQRALRPPFCLECKSSFPWRLYLLWPRRCPVCKRGRGGRTWLVEAFYVIASLWIWQFPPKYLGYGLGLILMILFGVIVVIDLEYRLILHQVSIAGAGLGLVAGVWWRAGQWMEQWAGSAVSGGWHPWWYGLWTTLLGGLTGFGSMWLLYALGEGLMRLLARLRGQALDDVALGFGDVNLSGVLGLILGWPLVWVGLFAGVLVGGVVSLGYMAVMLVRRKYHLFMALPYGPFLVIGAMILIFFRSEVAQLLR